MFHRLKTHLDNFPVGFFDAHVLLSA